MDIDLNNPVFHDEDKAREHLEAIRWPDGPICPHCGVIDEATKLTGKSTRPGVYKCRACQKPFSVTVGTVYERSHIPLHKWVLATHLLTSSKKGMSAHQLWRMLGFGSYRTAWFMAHRIREAMRELNPGPLGGSGKVVEADETYTGNKGRNRRVKRRDGMAGNSEQWKVVSLVERGGKARSKHVDFLTANAVRHVLVTNVDRKSDLMTDTANVYKAVGREFASHETVNHSLNEWARGLVHTNTIEGFFSIFKRGMKGIYQHCGEQHLHRYLAEFDFRYSYRMKLGYTDTARARLALKGIGGKRLTYRPTRQQVEAAEAETARTAVPF